MAYRRKGSSTELKSSTYHRAEGPNVRRSTPSYLELCFRAPPYRCPNDITVFREDRIDTHRIPTVGQLDVSETDITLSIVHQDVVELHICCLTLIRAFSVLRALRTIIIPVCT